MDAITETEFQKNIAPIFRSVFANENPYGEPFQPQIRPRLLLYEFQYGLSAPWLEPIVKSIRDLGEEGFFVSVLSRSRPTDNRISHWYVPLQEADRYIHDVFPLENAIYSVSGHWGLICSTEDHAVLGGSASMIENIRAVVGDLDDRTQYFLETWKRYHKQTGVDLGWELVHG